MKTSASRERDLREALQRKTTVVEVAKLRGKTLAFVDDEGPIRIVVDPARGGLIASTVHELAHRVYKRSLGAWGTLEEDIVTDVELDVMHRIDNDPARIRWWREAIAKKLAAGAE